MFLLTYYIVVLIILLSLISKFDRLWKKCFQLISMHKLHVQLIKWHEAWINNKYFWLKQTYRVESTKTKIFPNCLLLVFLNNESRQIIWVLMNSCLIYMTVERNVFLSSTHMRIILWLSTLCWTEDVIQSYVHMLFPFW